MLTSRLALALGLSLLSLPAFAQPAAPAVTLSGAEWKVTKLASSQQSAGEAPTISFGTDQRVAGASGCNRYMGGYTQDGQSLKFTELAGTMMACPPPRMELERAMLDALGNVTRFSITQGGALELFGAEGFLLRAER